jgi:hypothetical protein
VDNEPTQHGEPDESELCSHVIIICLERLASKVVGPDGRV